MRRCGSINLPEGLRSNVVGTRAFLFFVYKADLVAYSRYTLAEVYNLGQVTFEAKVTLSLVDNTLCVMTKMTNPYQVRKLNFFNILLY